MNKKKIKKISLYPLVILLTGCLTNCKEATSEISYSVLEEDDKNDNIDYSKKIKDLASYGYSDYTIVYPSDAGDAVIQGAKEIKQTILNCTDTFINIVTDEGLTYNSLSCYISVGNTKILKKSDLVFGYETLKHDGFFLKTSGNSVFIDGVSDRGVLYGTYEFCERVLGVKYLTYSDTYYPKSEVVSLYKMSIVSNPAFDDRCYINSKFYNDYQYMSRCRCIHEYRDFPEMYGGNIGWFKDSVYLNNYVHNSLDYVDPDIYYQDHKDWYFVKDGSICDLDYSHVGLKEDGTIDESKQLSPVKIAIESLKEFIVHSDKSIKYYMLGQMDLSYSCQCSDCIAQEAKYGRSGMNIRFVNAIYDEVSKWAKNNGISKEWYLATFAYQWSQSAPVKKTNNEYVALDPTVIPRDNVIVRIAPIQANNYFGMVDGRQNSKTRELFNGWKSILKGKKTMIWSYHSRFSFYFTYYPTMHHWQEDLNLYKEIGSQYIFMQPNCSEIHDWKVNMETYVASKMLWNPKLDANALKEEFFNYYYKEIADLVDEYNTNFEIQFSLMANRSDAPDMTIQGEEEILDTKYYSVPFWETQLSLINQMYQRINSLGLDSKDYSLFKTKVDELKLTSEFMILYRYNEYYFDDYWGKQSMLDDFFDTCLSLQVRYWRETNGAISTLKSLFGYTK